jgi:TfoX/Sxy family transcriptional regulator of competence genes
MSDSGSGGGRRAMPAFTKPPAELLDRFAAAVKALPDAEQRKMFGMPAAFARGQMFTGLFGPDWFLRLPDDGRREVEQLGGGPFEPMPGRGMKEYVVLPASVREDDAALERWLRRSLEYAVSLPPKKPKRG